MKISNTHHLPSYDVRPGGGKIYIYIESVEINKNSVEFTLIGPQNNFREVITINSPEEIALLPSLLDGRITGYDALQLLEPSIKKKYGINNSSSQSIPFFTLGTQQLETKKRIRSLAMPLVGENPFVSLCWFFPRTKEANDDWISYMPNKVVDDDIIEGIIKNFTLINQILSGYARGASIGFFDKSNPTKRLPMLPSSLIGEFIDRKDASILAQTTKTALNTAREEHVASIAKVSMN